MGKDMAGGTVIGLYNIPSTGLRFFTVGIREGLRAFAEWYRECSASEGKEYEM